MNGLPTAGSDQVGPVNFPLHLMFRQMALSFNQTVVSPDIGVNFPYKARKYLLLQSSSDMIHSQGQSGLYFKDQTGDMDGKSYTSSNVGFIERAAPTK